MVTIFKASIFCLISFGIGTFFGIAMMCVLAVGKDYKD